MAKHKESDPFNRALAMFLEWGPSMSIPVEQRIAKVLPQATKALIAAMIKEFTYLRSSASAIVIEQLEKKESEEQGRSRVAALDPRLSPDNAATLYTQSGVNAWRDGYPGHARSHTREGEAPAEPGFSTGRASAKPGAERSGARIPKSARGPHHWHISPDPAKTTP